MSLAILATSNIKLPIYRTGGWWRATFVVVVLIVAGCGYDNTPMMYRASKAQIRAFNDALGMFKAECGRYPTTAEGLQALVVCPTNIPANRWHQYLEKVPLDPWGHPYVYHCPGIYNTNSFDVYSCGMDGISKSNGNDEDDICNWESPSRNDPNRAEHLGIMLGAIVAFVLSISLLLDHWHKAKSAGNLHGLVALSWILGVAATLTTLVLSKAFEQYADRVASVLICSLLIPGILAVSGLRNGCRISKVCGWIVVILFALCFFLMFLALLRDFIGLT